jgi:hypothetical protein
LRNVLSRYRVEKRGGVPDVEIERVKAVAHVQLGIVVEPAAAKPFASVRHAPADHVARRVMIKMQVERDLIIQSEVFSVDRITFEHAQTERDGATVLPPYEEAYLVGHAPADFGEIRWGELFEMHAGAGVDLQIERIELLDDGGDVGPDLERDR